MRIVLFDIDFPSEPPGPGSGGRMDGGIQRRRVIANSSKAYVGVMEL